MTRDERPSDLTLLEYPIVFTSPMRAQAGKMMAPALFASFVHYYESAVDDMGVAHGTDPTAWPGVLRFGWAVRNAFAHDGKILFKNPNAAPATWRGLTFGPQDNGRQILYTDLMPADIVILMDEMDREF